jgi:hypothetical protein
VTRELKSKQDILFGYEIQSGNTRYGAYLVAQPAGFTMKIGDTVEFQEAARTPDKPNAFRAVNIKVTTSTVSEAMNTLNTTNAYQLTTYLPNQLIELMKRNDDGKMNSDELLNTIPGMFVGTIEVRGLNLFVFATEVTTPAAH